MFGSANVKAVVNPVVAPMMSAATPGVVAEVTPVATSVALLDQEATVHTLLPGKVEFEDDGQGNSAIQCVAAEYSKYLQPGRTQYHA